MTKLFIGLNLADLVITGIGLSMGAIEVGFYADIGLHSVWYILLVKAALVAIFLLIVYWRKMKRFILYGNILLILVCLWNLAAIGRMVWYR